MVSQHPKMATLPLVVVVMGAVQAGSVMLALAEVTATGGPRLDRGLGSLVVFGMLWGAVVAADLVLHPRMRMTRLIFHAPLTNACVVAGVLGVMSVGGAMLGDSLSTPTHLVGRTGFSFFGVWALTSLWGLLRERWRPTSQQIRSYGAHQELLTSRVHVG